MSPTSIPVELMEILNEINANIGKINERIARLEASTHQETISKLENDLKAESTLRHALELKVERIQNRLAPIVATVAVIGAAFVQYLFTIAGK